MRFRCTQHIPEQQLGHRSPRTTANLYADVSVQDDGWVQRLGECWSEPILSATKRIMERQAE